MRNRNGYNWNNMKKLKYLLTFLILYSCSTRQIIDYNKVYGLWEFPNTMVWIEIKPNNQVFQCRISPFDKVYKSRGHLKGNKIIWEEICRSLWGSSGWPHGHDVAQSRTDPGSHGAENESAFLPEHRSDADPGRSW